MCPKFSISGGTSQEKEAELICKEIVSKSNTEEEFKSALEAENNSLLSSHCAYPSGWQN